MNAPDPRFQSAPQKIIYPRLLEPGEVIQEGDEFYDAFERVWTGVSPHSIGKQMDAESLGRFRRT